MNNEKVVTGWRVWLFLIGAIFFALQGAYATWELVVQGEEIERTWFALAFTPMAVLFWATYIRRAVPQNWASS